MAIAKRLPEGVSTEPSEDSVELTLVRDVALELKRQFNWCDDFWGYLKEIGITRDVTPVKSTVTFTIDPDSNYIPTAYRGTPVSQWDAYAFYRFFSRHADYGRSVNDLGMSVTTEAPVEDPNAGKYIKKDVLLKFCRKMKRDGRFEGADFWEIMSRFGIEKPAVKPVKITMEFTPAQLELVADSVDDPTNATRIREIEKLLNILRYSQGSSDLTTVNYTAEVLEETPAQ